MVAPFVGPGTKLTFPRNQQGKLQIVVTLVSGEPNVHFDHHSG
jgi:hypothetical protein